MSKLDVATWIFSCLITALSYNSSYALFSSAFFALCTIVVRTQWPKFQLLVNVTGSGAYYAERNYYGSELLEESGVAVMRFEAPLLFNNCTQFKKDVISVAENIRGFGKMSFILFYILISMSLDKSLELESEHVQEV